MGAVKERFTLSHFKPVLIADWFIVKLRVWHDCFSLGPETNQHLIVAGTHVRVSLVRGNKFSLRKPKRHISGIDMIVEA